MTNLAKWENIMKEKNMNLSFKDYSQTILSWLPFVLHKNNGLISRFPDSDRIKGVVKSIEFDKNSDNLINNGVDSGNKGLFADFSQLFRSIDLPNMMHFYGYENADYADVIGGGKNVYLSFVVITECENILYSCSVKDGSRNIVGSIMVWDNSENVFESSGIIQSFNVFYSKCIEGSSDIWFSSNLIGCTECILCDNLSNQSYCIKNKQYSKEEYLVRKQEVLKLKKHFNGFVDNIPKAGNLSSINCTGENIIKSDNVTTGRFVYNVKNGENLILVGGKGDNFEEYSTVTAGSPYGNNFYGCMSVSGDNLYCCCHIALSSHIYYSYFLLNCSFCIGCVGLRNKSYCILNKQYTKEEWEVLADKIFAQMDADGILGDFFPGELNPFYFNDTMAYLIDDSFTKEEVVRDGYMWRDEKIKVDIPDAAKVIKVKDLDQYQGYDTEGNWQISDDILKKVIQDEQGNFYKIVPMELDFLRKHALPLPELHWLDRIKMGFRM